MKNRTGFISESLIDHCIFLYTIFCSLLILYMHDGHFDLMRSKALFFRYGMYLVLPVFLIVILLKLLKWRRKFDLFDRSVLFFLFASVVSTFNAYDLEYAFTGQQGWYVGFFVILSLVIVYFTLKGGSLDQKSRAIIAVIFIVETLLVIADCARLDLFGLKKEFREFQYYIFFGTIGNSNWFVAYLSLFVPYYLYLYITEEKDRTNIFLFFVAALGVTASVLLGPDGIYIAFYVSFAFLIPYLVRKKEYLVRFLRLSLTVILILLLISILPVFGKRIERMAGIGKLIMDRTFLMFLFVSLSLCLFYLTKQDGKKFEKIRKRICLVSEGLLPLLAVAVICLVISRSEDDVSNGRLFLWQYSIRSFLNRYPLKLKLIGIGPELLNNVYGPLAQGFDTVYVCSHSEPIQVLMTMGILGMIAWIGMWGSLFLDAYRSKGSLDPEKVALLAGMVGYFGQCFINSATCPNLCYLVLFAALYRRKTC